MLNEYITDDQLVTFYSVISFIVMGAILSCIEVFVKKTKTKQDDRLFERLRKYHLSKRKRDGK